MERRNFLKSSLLGTAGFVFMKNSAGSNNAFNKSIKHPISFAGESPSKPVDIKLNVKPVYLRRIHVAEYSGPCRWSPKSPEEEKVGFKQGSKRFIENVRSNISEDANVLEPLSVVLGRTYLEYAKGDIIDPKVWKKIDREVSDIDFFLTNYRFYGLERYKKPAGQVSTFSSVHDWSAFLRNKGVEGFACYDWEDMNELIKLLRVRKALQHTKILRVSDRPGDPPVCVLSGIDLKDMRDMYGVDYQDVSYKEFFDEMDRISRDKTEQEKASSLHKKLINHAQNVFMNKEYILNDINFYLTSKSLMERYNCNAYTLRCFELCGSRIAFERKIVPCLSNLMLRDEGYPSTCEGDTNALFTVMIFMYLTNKPAYMGNTWYYAKENKLKIAHDAASLRMKGLEKPDLPYEIQSFVDKGHGEFGTTVRYDFARDKGQTVTIARFNPYLRVVAMAKGTIAGGVGFRNTGCTLGLEVDVPDVKGLYDASRDTGNHLVLVYGDHTGDIKKLSEILHYEVREA